MTETTVQAGASAPAAGPGITEPGLYPGVTADQYHADPVAGGSLSSTGARRLLPPSCPALFRHEQDHGQEPRATFDFGSAAHRIVLGDGPTIHVIDAPDWRTKAAREERDQAREDGLLPLLEKDYEQVAAMADAIRTHPVASKLFAPGTGRPEQTLVWRDEPTGVMCRARLDWLPNKGARPRLIVPDYKTAVSAEPTAFQRTVDTYGYHQQAAWYLSGVKALGMDPEPQFLFVVQEKSAPYLVTVFHLDHMAMRIGAAKNRHALQVFKRCRAENRWPGYDDEVVSLQLPQWAENRDIEEYL